MSSALTRSQSSIPTAREGWKSTRSIRELPADRAGLHQGDVIRSANGYLTEVPGNLAWIITNAAPKNILKMVVRTAIEWPGIHLHGHASVIEATRSGPDPKRDRPSEGFLPDAQGPVQSITRNITARTSRLTTASIPLGMNFRVLNRVTVGKQHEEAKRENEAERDAERAVLGPQP